MLGPAGIPDAVVIAWLCPYCNSETSTDFTETINVPWWEDDIDSTTVSDVVVFVVRSNERKPKPREPPEVPLGDWTAEYVPAAPVLDGAQFGRDVRIRSPPEWQ